MRAAERNTFWLSSGRSIRTTQYSIGIMALAAAMVACKREP